MHTHKVIQGVNMAIVRFYRHFRFPLYNHCMHYVCSCRGLFSMIIMFSGGHRGDRSRCEKGKTSGQSWSPLTQLPNFSPTAPVILYPFNVVMSLGWDDIRPYLESFIALCPLLLCCAATPQLWPSIRYYRP